MSLYIFDKDGTLVATIMTWLRLRPPILRPEDQVLKPGVFEKLAELRQQGHVLAIASNQEAVAKGWISLEEAEELMRNCAAKVGGVNAWKMCPYHKKARRKINGLPNPYRKDTDFEKPRPGMLLDLMQMFGCGSDNTIVVGNTSKDRKAAKAVGAKFIPARRFFRSRPKSR